MVNPKAEAKQEMDAAAWLSRLDDIAFQTLK